MATQHQLDYQDSAYAGTVLLMMDTGEIYRDNLETLNENTGMEESSDAWLTNGQTLGQEFRSTYFLRMLHLKQTFGADQHIALGAGKGNPILGHGLIYNDCLLYTSPSPRD